MAKEKRRGGIYFARAWLRCHATGDARRSHAHQSHDTVVDAEEGERRVTVVTCTVLNTTLHHGTWLP